MLGSLAPRSVFLQGHCDDYIHLMLIIHHTSGVHSTPTTPVAFTMDTG